MYHHAVHSTVHDGIRGDLGSEASGGIRQERAVHDGVGALPGGCADTPRRGERYIILDAVRFVC